MTLDQLKATKISIAFNGLSGEDIQKDNWNLQSMAVNARGKADTICVFSASGNPLYRFQNGESKGQTYDSGGPGALSGLGATDGMILTDYPDQCP